LNSPRPFFQSEPASAGTEQRLLLISYHFPPGQAVGALRWQKMAGFFAERGWQFDVITLDPRDLQFADMRRMQELPFGTRVFGVPEPKLGVERAEQVLWSRYRKLRPRRAVTARPEASPANSVTTSVYSADLRWSFANIGDWKRAYHGWLDFAHHAKWAAEAARLGATIFNPQLHRAVISCGPPHMAHDAARQVAETSGLPLVVDMRDPWSLVQRLPEAVASPVWLHYARRYEQRVIARASLVVANTERARLIMAERYPEAQDRIVTVMNGYDDEPFPFPRHGSRFLVVYAGTIYLDRDPSVLLRAAGQVVRDLKLTPTQFGIAFIGNVDAGFPVSAIAEREGLGGFVTVEPPMTRAQLFETLAGAAMLVSLPQDSNAAIPPKVFEYLGFHAWQLAFTEQGSATDMVLRGTGADVVAPDDLDTTAAVLRARFEQFAAGARPMPLASDRRLSRRHQASIFLDHLEKICPASNPQHVVPN
jgi:hypothetical protein